MVAEFTCHVLEVFKKLCQTANHTKSSESWSDN